MRRTLREVGRIRAGASDVVLRMSVGVHSGTYAMFLVGGSHRELLIGGPAATHGGRDGGPGLGRADPAQPGHRRAAAARLPRRAARIRECCSRARRRAARLGAAGGLSRAHRTRCDRRAACRRSCARTCSAARRARAPDGVGRVPPVQRPRRADRARRRRARPRSALDELVRPVQDACDRYEVCFLDSDISADGGKIRLSAGAPRVVGDDEERMLLALRQIVEADPPLPVQVGVNRGPVFTGEVGPPYRRWYAVMGDTVNLAARVMGKAPAGHIYATREVLRQVEDGSGRRRSSRSRSRARPDPSRRGTSGRRSAPDRGAAIRPRAAAGRPRARARAAAGRRSRTRGAARGRSSSSSARPAAASRGCWPRRASCGEGMRCCARRARWSRARRRTSRGASCCASCSGSIGTTPRSACASGSRPRSSAAARPAAVAAADRDRGRRRGAGDHRGRRSWRPRPARPSCARSCCGSSAGRWSCRRSSRSSTRT